MPSKATRNYPLRADWICNAIAEGRPLAEICAEEGMPKLKTVRRWLRDSPDFRCRYARARKMHAEQLVLGVIEIADGLKEGAGDAETRRQRLRIDARKWAVAQLRSPDLHDVEPEDAPPPPCFIA